MGATLHDYWIAIYSRKYLILAVGLVSAVFAWAISSWLPPVYEAKASFYVPVQMAQAQASDRPTQQSPLLPVPEEKSSGVNVGIIKSKDIARRVQQLFPDKPLGYFQKNVDFVIGNGFTVDIYVRDRNPKVAAAIANAFPPAYDEFHSKALSRRDVGAGIAIRKQLDDVTQQLATLTQRLEQAKGGRTLLPESQQMDLFKAFKTNLEDSDAEIRATRERIRKIEQQLKAESSNYEPGEVVLDSPRIDALKSTVTQLEIDLAKPSNDLREEHPQVKALKSQLDIARAALHTEISRMIKSRSKPSGSLYETLRRELIEQVNQLKYYEAKAEALQTSLQKIDDSIKSDMPRIDSLETLQKERDQMQTLEATLKRSLHQVTMQEQYPQSSIVFLEHAYPPDHPAFPVPPLNAVVAMLLGLAGGCYYALFLDYLSRLKHARTRRQMDRSPIQAFDHA